ncbi:hypothetical protein [Paludibaculum fermentans]|uniref:DUF4142 domain-containing protein n=1 Tax=Paludibaculum fermentans TaxID=1473598 RepID=A0A7S7NVS6_PALFE|nr:hypothetical protein [Paludibaculum fermentans]QOY90725.1 hypothetical protein IRI77_12495 [Paludibaculum fermentans]
MKLNYSWCVCALSAAMAVVPATAATLHNSAEVLMKDAGAKAFNISDNAQAIFLSEPESNISWQGQAMRLEAIKNAVQQISGDVGHLNLWGEMESPAERKAVEEANPLLKDLAAQTSDAIRFLNDNTNHLFLPEYRQHLQKIAQDANQLRALFRESTKLNSLSRKAEHLREELSHS